MTRTAYHSERHQVDRPERRRLASLWLAETPEEHRTGSSFTSLRRLFGLCAIDASAVICEHRRMLERIAGSIRSAEVIELLAAIFRRWRMVVDIRFVERDDTGDLQLPTDRRSLLGPPAERSAWETIDLDRLEAEIERATRDIQL